MAGFAPPKQFRGSGDLRALLEANWRYLSTYLNTQGGSGTCCIYLSSNQTFTANTTLQDVSFDAVEWDTKGWADLSAGRIKVGSDGLYLAHFEFMFDGQEPGGNGYLTIRVNGSNTSSMIMRQGDWSAIGSIGSLVHTAQLQLEAGDAVGVELQPNSQAVVLRGGSSGSHVTTKLIVTKL